MPMFYKMLDLEIAHPEMYQLFRQGNFTATMSYDCAYNRMEADKVICVNLNIKPKSSCGTTGLSRKQNSVNEREINLSSRAVMRAYLYEYLDYKPKQYVHSE